MKPNITFSLSSRSLLIISFQIIVTFGYPQTPVVACTSIEVQPGVQEVIPSAMIDQILARSEWLQCVRWEDFIVDTGGSILLLQETF